MMRFTRGNLLDDAAQALVNTVNTVGVMGKGVALMFKEAYPENFKAYEEACRSRKFGLARCLSLNGAGRCLDLSGS